MIGWLWIALGGALGAISRHGISLLAGSLAGTLLVNISGSFTLAFLLASEPKESMRLLVGTGFLGAFTTMSAFSVQTLNLLRTSPVQGVGYMTLMITTCVLGALAGTMLLR